MFDYAVSKYGSAYVISNWPEPSKVKQFIKRAKQNIRSPFPEIEPDFISVEPMTPNHKSKYIFASDITHFENEKVLKSVNNNQQLIFYHKDLLKYLTLEYNSRLQLDGTCWTITPGVYSQVVILVSTYEVTPGKYLDCPVIYCFMDTRRESSYDLMFQSINELLKKNCNGKLDSGLVVTDHEDGMISALRKVIDFTCESKNLRLCNCHTNKNLRDTFRNMLAPEIEQNGEQFKLNVHKYFVVCYKLYFETY